MLTLTSLFVGAFLAATILPFSSEAMLVSALVAGDVNKWALVTVAAGGNILGALLNWWLGSSLLHWSDKSWFPFSEAQLVRANQRFAKYGTWSLLFAWLPIIGDPLTFAAGVLKTPLPLFLVLVSVGKTARYLAIGLAI